MSRLPPEILHKIFYQLAFRDRLECTLVCRSWWRILDKYSLFYNVEIIYEINEFSKFMEMFMRSPHRAAQVQKMRLLSCLNISFNKRTLLNTFPNVRVLKVEWSDGWIRQCEESSYFSEPIKMTRSTSKIKVLHDSVHCELALQMLKSNLCGRLEVLALNFSDVSHVSIQVILKKLKNLPVLKRLTLQNVAIKINNLESIHKNIPTVETFRLIDVSIRPGKAPSHVTSASSISTLEIDICRAVDRELHSRFYQYICKKYPNITNIEYNDQQLKSYTPDDLSYVYLNGIYDFYKYIIIPNKKKLKIKDIPNDFNLFELADHLNCQFEELHFIQYKGEALFGYLAQSHQSKHIQKLILNDTVIAPLAFVHQLPQNHSGPILYTPE
ncbi:hypothetical protein K501DRAFT_266267 [Backusella circina FSU 941]|nr:hypothetical protein K501DRAFT_266267 [Backusella circina FSU 941]